jgi:hypothetical protein
MAVFIKPNLGSRWKMGKYVLLCPGRKFLGYFVFLCLIKYAIKLKGEEGGFGILHFSSGGNGKLPVCPFGNMQ